MAPKKPRKDDKTPATEKRDKKPAKESSDARLDRMENVLRDLRPSAFAESREPREGEKKVDEPTLETGDAK
jgi:hypothetical protein